MSFSDIVRVGTELTCANGSEIVYFSYFLFAFKFQLISIISAKKFLFNYVVFPLPISALSHMSAN